MQPAVLYSSAAAVLTFHKKSNSALLDQLKAIGWYNAYSVELGCSAVTGTQGQNMVLEADFKVVGLPV
jgi:hypothetical protein